MLSEIVDTEINSTLGYKNKLKLLQQSLVLQLNLMPLESNSLCKISSQYYEGWNITPENIWSGGYIICGWKNTNWQQGTWWYQEFLKDCLMKANINILQNVYDEDILSMKWETCLDYPEKV